MNHELPFEVSEFEQLLRKPNSDASGLASFFTAGEVWATRVPARLDVMAASPIIRARTFVKRCWVAAS